MKKYDQINEPFTIKLLLIVDENLGFPFPVLEWVDLFSVLQLGWLVILYYAEKRTNSYHIFVSKTVRLHSADILNYLPKSFFSMW